MKVIYVTGARFAGGGIGNTAYHAVLGLHQNGLLSRLVCGSYRSTEIPELQIRAMGMVNRILRRLVLYDRSRLLYYLECVLFDRWASRQIGDGDLLHAWGNYGLQCLIQAKQQGMITVIEKASTYPAFQARLVAEEHARWGISFRIPSRLIERGIRELDRADYILVPSDFVYASFIKQGIPAGKLLKIPFGVDTSRFTPWPKRRGDPFRVLFVGQVSFRKGIPYLLQAWQLLGWKDAELYLVGRGDPEIAPILQEYRDLPGLRRIPYTPDPVPVFQQADVFAFPTIAEGSALVTYEAMACGLPVVTTHHSGAVLQDQVQGYYVPIRDPHGLAASLDTLRRDDLLRDRMSRAARNQAENYTWAKYGQRLSDRYRALH